MGINAWVKIEESELAMSDEDYNALYQTAEYQSALADAYAEV